MVMQAWSVERVRVAEEAAKKFLPDDELMNRAAHGLANVLATRTDEIAQHTSPGEDVRMIVLAGPGGNGGDALFAAAFLRHLHTTRLEETNPTQAHVADIVPVLLTGQAHPSALQAIHDAGLTPLDASTDEGLATAVHMIATADIIVDGLFGIGGRLDLSHHDENTPPPAAWTLVNAIPDDAYLIAVDVASGTDPAGETETDNCVWADETVTFSLIKGTHLLAGENATGLLTIIDIGIDEYGLLGLGTDGELANENEDHIDALLTDGPATPMAERLTFDDVSHMWPTPGPRDDKYSRGVVGIIAGGENYTGAAILTVTAAVNTGAGMVRYIGPPTPTNLIRTHIPEAVHGPGKVQAWVIGPGLDPHPVDDDETGHTHLTHARQALDSNEPAVIDAGGLDLLTGPRPHAGAPTLITPPPGALARPLPPL
ncbi:bifunctional ADP-dependent NAD(P)H-hydrate dehydratase/NAD(P)H-hydrate epimerase, partial [Dermatophilus congolensis]|uniref:bifunctional ADP-dependent NAD(P)H-hydrate dehydratase/NAD(P)H-hydrate epimerase n=1 Tax=Dermatophilus congolensis TaxID=1863 RepID=UPI001FBADC93